MNIPERELSRGELYQKANTKPIVVYKSHPKIKKTKKPTKSMKRYMRALNEYTEEAIMSRLRNL